MTTVPLAELVSLMAKATTQAKPPKAIGSPPLVSVADEPTPYIAPELSLNAGDDLRAEVVTIQAAAAAGKSVTAKYLSHATHAPLVDMAKVTVSHAGLDGILARWARSSSRAFDAFHRGELPVIVDAVDEGVLLTGETGVHQFIEQMVEFIIGDRTCTNRPKVILLGRDDAVEISRLIIEVEGGNSISVCNARLNFFTYESAIKLIPLYARRRLEESIHNLTKRRRLIKQLQSEETKKLLDAYFETIAKVLNLGPEELWADDRGRAFAGYAPTLSSLGTLLAHVSNPHGVLTRLASTGGAEAWNVISTVVTHVLEREQKEKFQPQLGYDVEYRTTGDSDPLIGPDGWYGAYSPEEQLTYLAALYEREPVELVQGLMFHSNDNRADYVTKVNQQIEAHPFAPGGANDVLGSKVMAYALVRQRTHGTARFKALSRQPFLWRFFKQMMATEQILIEGDYVGFVLNSYWNDPTEPIHAQVKILCGSDGIAEVIVDSQNGTEQLSFQATAPIVMYERVKHCDLRMEYAREIRDMYVELVGAKHGTIGGGHLRFEGNNSLVCGRLVYSCDVANLKGSLYLDADEVVVSSSSPRIRVVSGAKYCWSEKVANLEPWRLHTDVDTQLAPGSDTDDQLVGLIDACVAKFDRGEVYLKEGYRIPSGSDNLRWISHDGYADVFSEFVALLVDTGLATCSVHDAQGATPNSRTIRVVVDTASLKELKNAWRAQLKGDNFMYTPKVGDFVSSWAAKVDLP